MFDSIEYSLSSQISNNNNDFVLNKKIFDIIKTNNKVMTGGGNINDYIGLIIGIIFIGIGIFLYFNNPSWSSTQATIENIYCGSNSTCDITILYTINQTNYSKIIQMSNLDTPISNTITIYYQQSNPNIIRLYNFNYSLIGIGLGVIGLGVIITPMFLKSNTNNTSLQTHTDIYNNLNIHDGLNIVYS